MIRVEEVKMRSTFKRSNSMLLTALAAIALLCSCMPVYSIHPFFTGKDMVFDPALLGTWFDADDTEDRGVVVIEQMDFDGQPGYEITLRGITKETSAPELAEKFDARLFQLGGSQFLDVVQSDLLSGDEQIGVFAMPVHMIAKVSLEQDALTLHFLDDEWTTRSIESGDVSIAHETEGGTPVLTAQTTELEKLILDHADDKDAFSFDVGPLQRKK